MWRWCVLLLTLWKQRSWESRESQFHVKWVVCSWTYFLAKCAPWTGCAGSRGNFIWMVNEKDKKKQTRFFYFFWLSSKSVARQRSSSPTGFAVKFYTWCVCESIFLTATCFAPPFFKHSLLAAHDIPLLFRMTGSVKITMLLITKRTEPVCVLGIDGHLALSHRNTLPLWDLTSVKLISSDWKVIVHLFTRITQLWRWHCPGTAHRVKVSTLLGQNDNLINTDSVYM